MLIGTYGIIFQSTLPRRERHTIKAPSKRKLYFNPHSREGSDLSGLWHGRSSYYFNPRSREGSDDFPLWYARYTSKISIHAPAKGATYTFAYLFFLAIYFNPRSREGSDELVVLLAKGMLNFNPRSREGSDRRYQKTGCAAENFNPRSREGSDFLLKIRCPEHSDFNPRSREGSDRTDSSNRCCERCISIHAPAKGATI